MPYTAGNAARYSCKPSLFANSVKKEQSEKLLFSLVRTDGKTRAAGGTEKPAPPEERKNLHRRKNGKTRAAQRFVNRRRTRR